MNSFIFFDIILRPKFCIYKEENIIYFLIIYLQDATRKFGEAIHFQKKKKPKKKIIGSIVGKTDV